jgi:hypothetical protein
MNQSKVADPRTWDRWAASGALASIPVFDSMAELVEACVQDVADGIGPLPLLPNLTNNQYGRSSWYRREWDQLIYELAGVFRPESGEFIPIPTADVLTLKLCDHPELLVSLYLQMSVDLQRVLILADTECFGLPDWEQCPGCAFKAPASDLGIQRQHMEAKHPEIIQERMVNNGFTQLANGSWHDDWSSD